MRLSERFKKETLGACSVADVLLDFHVPSKEACVSVHYVLSCIYTTHCDPLTSSALLVCSPHF